MLPCTKEIAKTPRSRRSCSRPQTSPAPTNLTKPFSFSQRRTELTLDRQKAVLVTLIITDTTRGIRITVQGRWGVPVLSTPPKWLIAAEPAMIHMPIGQLPVYPVRKNVGQTIKLSRVAERGDPHQHSYDRYPLDVAQLNICIVREARNQLFA